MKDSNKYIIFITTIILYFFSSLFKLIPITLFKIDYKNMSGNTSIILSIFSNIVLIFIFYFFYKKDLITDFKKFKNDDKRKKIFDSILLWIIGLIIMFASTWIASLLGIDESSNNLAVKNMFTSNPILAGITVIFLTPIIEEIVFRLSFRKVIPNGILFVIISGLVFGSLHILSITNINELFFLIPYCSLGIILSYIYYKGDSIYYTFIIHILHNLLIALLVLGGLAWEVD